MKKIKVIIMSLLLIMTILLTIPSAYALDPMPNYYSRTNNALTKLYDGQNANGTFIRYQTDPSYIYQTIMSTSFSYRYYDPFLVVISDTDFTTTFQYFLANNISINQAIVTLYNENDADNFNLILFGEYSDDDDRTKLIFPLNQYGGQSYVYLYTKEMVSYASDSMFIISDASYNQYMNYLLTSNLQYQSGYWNAREDYGQYIGGTWFTASQRFTQGYNNAKNEFGLRGGVYGDANYWYTQGLEATQLDVWSALWIAFTTPFTLFEIEMLPGVTIGMIALIPLVLGLIAFIFSLGGKKK